MFYPRRRYADYKIVREMVGVGRKLSPLASGTRFHKIAWKSLFGSIEKAIRSQKKRSAVLVTKWVHASWATIVGDYSKQICCPTID